jgi:adenylate cyclase
VGLATGELMVGNCGSTQRLDYTAIGDTVNLASRLEGANKFFGTFVLASEDTWRLRAK